jgi:predicted DNA-binding protein
VDSVTYRKLNELAKKTNSRVSNVVRTMIENCLDMLEDEADEG